MAFFEFGKKKEEIPPMQAPPQEPIPSTPIDGVIQMREQGLSNNQIIQNLQRQGFDSNQIFDAINQADVKGGVESVPQGEMQAMPPLANPVPQNAPYPQTQYPQGNYPQTQQQTPHHNNEELIESIVAEKWEQTSAELKKIQEWQEKTEVNLAKTQQSVMELKGNFDKLHQAIIGKISEYDQNILNVGTEIKAMEKIFQKVLPTFTENLNELSRVTKNLKAKKTIAKPLK